MSPALEGKVAIITGAGRGIGRAFALRFAEEGAKLLLPDISLERAADTVKEIKTKGGEAVAMKADISDENDTKKIADKVMQQYGKVDILINNAAVWYGLEITPWDAWTVEDWDRIFAVNVKGTWLCCKAIAPLMIRQSKGKIINIASGVAKAPVAQLWLPYSCSKGAVYTLTHALARALGPSGINVNAIAPGHTASEASLVQRDSGKAFKIGISERSIQRREEPADLVGTAVFLASADSDFITGQVI
ncbi:MAG: SDR family NAD(P)-dependent oxidoreductase, partial [Dehalococcoidia bacterium]|nr:SDR family NAD(P)-dependent oxidoreductase [Dehalococcoidia bacterium]